MGGLFKILVSGAVAAFVIAEGVFRFGFGLGDPPLVELDPEIEYMLKPAASYKRFGNEISVNALRMRSQEMAPEKPEGAIRILIVGDSVVYGNHHIDQAETIAARLKEKLSERYNCVAEVGAVAASSWGPANQNAFIDRFGLFDADAVMVVQSSHDIADYPSHKPDLIPYRLNPSYLATIDAATMFIERMLRRVQKKQMPLDFETRRSRSIAALRQMFERISEQGSKSVLFFHPIINEVSAGKPQDSRTVAIYEATAVENDAVFVDLTSTYRAHLADDNNPYLDHIHPSPAGASAIATKMAETLETIGVGCDSAR